jgi:hypothetical protein
VAITPMAEKIASEESSFVFMFFGKLELIETESDWLVNRIILNKFWRRITSRVKKGDFMAGPGFTWATTKTHAMPVNGRILPATQSSPT